MLTIRKEQMAAFQEMALKPLRERMFRDLQKHWSYIVTDLGDEETWRWIDHGFSRALHYGIDTERDLHRYVNLMFFLGYDFDTNPDLPWVPPILTAPDITPCRKLDELVARALEEAEEGGEP